MRVFFAFKIVFLDLKSCWPNNPSGLDKYCGLIPVPHMWNRITLVILLAKHQMMSLPLGIERTFGDNFDGY